MKNKRHARRVKRLALMCTMCTIILIVSTYAWFIGMRTVNVSSFDVEIAATEGLYLSLDGITWSETVAINKDNYDVSTYSTNTNTWGGKDPVTQEFIGLIPMSTVGEIDAGTDGEVSRLMLFEKGSLTTTDGGYRLMASRVDNYSETALAKEEEGVGFVAFDLFVKNMSGNEYYTKFNSLNEEAIYLTQASNVSVKLSGSDVLTEEDKNQLKTGIENSVRVAFAQIGRVIASEDTSTVIQGITCKTTAEQSDNPTSDDGVTGICDRYAQIWEPNDTKHVQNAINWYDGSCLKRTGSVDADGKLNGFEYETDTSKDDCTALADGAYSQTYPVGSVIDYSNYVDVYDGTAYNTYDKSISATKLSAKTIKSTFSASATSNAGKLYEYDYFTDTEKMKLGIERPIFMTLAPNSITKVRVYVYIEGQDVDNYDFASLGKQIKVSFGFTKERFFGSDINYQGPDGVPTTPETWEQ